MSENQFTDLILAVDELPISGNLSLKALLLELLALNARLTLELCQLRSQRALDQTPTTA